MLLRRADVGPLRDRPDAFLETDVQVGVPSAHKKYQEKHEILFRGSNGGLAELTTREQLQDAICYRHVEIGHPVYALLFQCVTVQACGQGLSLLALALTGRSWCSPREWEQVNGFVRIVVRQFYEITWAAVTHLRWEMYSMMCIYFLACSDAFCWTMRSGIGKGFRADMPPHDITDGKFAVPGACS